MPLPSPDEGNMVNGGKTRADTLTVLPAGGQTLACDDDDRTGFQNNVPISVRVTKVILPNFILKATRKAAKRQNPFKQALLL